MGRLRENARLVDRLSVCGVLGVILFVVFAVSIVHAWGDMAAHAAVDWLKAGIYR